MIKEHEKNNKRYIFAFAIIGLLMLSSSVTSTYTQGDFWSRLDNTLVLTDITDNVNIGENATTEYKLNVNGSLNIANKITASDWSFLYNNNIFNQTQTFISGVEMGNGDNDGTIAFEGTNDFLILWEENHDILNIGYGAYSGLIKLNDDVDISGDLGLSSTSKLTFGIDTVNITKGGLGVIEYNVNEGLAPSHTFRVKGKNLMQFKGGFSAVTYCIFNEDSNNMDFRVESDNDVYSLLINGQSGYVGISDNYPVAQLDVGGGTKTYVDGVDDCLIKDDLEVDGDSYLQGLVNATTGFATDVGQGLTFTFTCTEGTVTVTNGIITGKSW